MMFFRFAAASATVSLVVNVCSAEVLRGSNGVIQTDDTVSSIGSGRQHRHSMPSSHLSNTSGSHLPVAITTFGKPLSSSNMEQPFRFYGEFLNQLHPHAIAKPSSKAAGERGVSSIQYYEASLPGMTSVVLNIFAVWSNGAGGLTLVLEVPSPCVGSGQEEWVAVDRTRCSSLYPCALRLPSRAGLGNIKDHDHGAMPAFTRFRTRVVEDDENYGTDVLRYSRVTLDYESVVVVATSEPGLTPAQFRSINVDLSQAMASGSLHVIPEVLGAAGDTRVTMRIRQRNVIEPKYAWAKEWRTPSADLEGCSYRHFEVVADGIFEGPMEVEVEVIGDEMARLGTVMIVSRLDLAEAETHLLETVLQAHSHFFMDPANVIHGLPMTTINPNDPGAFAWSNPTEWGFVLTSLAAMAEVESLSYSDAVGKISLAFKTMENLQSQPDQFTKGLFYPFYKLRNTNRDDVDYGKILDSPERTDYLELPCGDNALLYSSLVLVRGWLLTNKFHEEAALAESITSKFNFDKCIHRKRCLRGKLKNSEDLPWAVALTVNAGNDELFPFDWNVWADEGGVVGMTAMLADAMSGDQFEDMVAAQQMYSPCETWQNITVQTTAYFNSIFTLPTRSFLGFGTLFSSPTYHDFSLRSVLPTFRAHRATKGIVGDDFFGPSDAMSQDIGSVAFFPPNTQYNPCVPKQNTINTCTWCSGQQYVDSHGNGLGRQYIDSDEGHHLSVSHGGLVSFLATATMETSQVVAWVDDLKGLMSDASRVYNASYGFQVLAPNKRTPISQKSNFAQTATDSKSHGAGYYEALSHSYTSLSLYEGLAAVRRRFELLHSEGAQIRGPRPSWRYRPLSDFLDAVPGHRARIDELLQVAKVHENKKICRPSDYGPSPLHEF